MSTPFDSDEQGPTATPLQDLGIEIQAELGRLVELSGAFVAVQDPDDNLHYMNTAFRDAFFVEQGEALTWEALLRRNYQHKRGVVIEVDDFETWIVAATSRRGKVANRSFETNLHDGRWIWCVITIRSDGWLIFVGTDVTEMRGSKRELRQARDRALAATEIDELTGVSSRHHIMSLLSATMSGDHAKQTAGGCACLIDIDFFKRINDDLGHQVGDQVLRSFAQLIRRTIRLADGLGRVGGEEFLLVMPATDVTQATTLIDRIYEALRTATLIPDKPERRVTFSAGLTRILETDTIEDIYKRADNALYDAKGAGRYKLSISPETQT